MVAVRMAHDVVGGFVGGHDDGVGGFLVTAGRLAGGLDEGPRQRQQVQVAGDGQGPVEVVGMPVILGGMRAPRTISLV